MGKPSNTSPSNLATRLFTVDTYGHLIPEGNRAAVDRLDAQHAEIGTGSKTGSGLEAKVYVFAF
jgi:hypothetical protein